MFVTSLLVRQGLLEWGDALKAIAPSGITPVMFLRRRLEVRKEVAMLDLIRRPSTSLGLSTFEEMDRLFDNMLRSLSLPATSFNLPSVDIYSEDDKHMVVEMPAPGFDENDIDVSVRDGVLEVRGERHEKKEQKDKERSYMVRESTASFARRVVLPEGADADKIEAELERGLLRITVPVERTASKRIKIAAKPSDSKRLSAENKNK